MPPITNSDPPSLAAEAARLFDEAFRRRSRTLAPKPEIEDDRAFLTQLFMACSPMADFMPEAMLRQQSEAQSASHRFEHPDAMRRIIWHDSRPVGRIAIDWSCDPVRGVDIAVLPDGRSTGAALLIMRAWMDVLDRQQRMCTLAVVQGNRAERLYARMGFAVDPDYEDDPILEMIRYPLRRGL